jgi:putative ABC transport system permease protein
MTLKDFRLGWRLFVRQPVFSAITVAGLAIGFAVCFLVLGFTRYEFGFDTNVARVDEVFVLKAHPNWGPPFWSENVPLSMKETLERSGVPMAVSAVLPSSAAMRVGTVVRNVGVALVDPALEQVFGLKPLEGDLHTALSRPDALALSDETARQLFGSAQAVGREVSVQGQSYRVAAVLPKQPATSSLQFEALAGLNSGIWSARQRERALDPWSYYSNGEQDFVSNKVYLRGPPGMDRTALRQRLVDAVEASALRSHLSARDKAELGARPLLDVAFGPLADSYLDSAARRNSGVKGDRIAIYAMNVVALLILLLTAGNYVNLATIRVIARQREMAVRKVLGISSVRLVFQMMAESIVVAVCAALLGALLAVALLPAWSDMTSHPIGAILGAADWSGFVVLVLALGVLLGAGASIYPAWVALGMRAAEALSGRGGSETVGGLWLRRVLTVTQFAIALFVSAMIVAIAWQINYLKDIDYGYEVDTLLVVSLPEDLTRAQAHSLRDELVRQPELAGVAASARMTARRDYLSTRAETVKLDTQRVSPEYFATIGLGAVAGRVFDPRLDTEENAKAVVINRLAAQRLGYADAASAVGRFVKTGDSTVQIVGISRDVAAGFNAGPPKAVVYQIAPDLPELTIRARGDLASAQAAVESAWRGVFPDRFPRITSLRTRIELNASGPQVILTLCAVIGAVIVPLAVLSMYVLSAHSVQRRSREIVIRKLHGAGPADIARLLVREFSVLLAVAALFGLPLAWFASRMFVEQFADQAPIGPWALCAALVGAALVTALATARHTLMAMRLSPAVALRAA